ncbi:D-alanyl-D-alanine carboxypeptidase [Glaciihabitans sp. UYNi722]|uniref:D-alanyl-D-alanine carboxypeptidase family protein n=1 Tax=Glaciihabitans sp. UYNi722 TaxID=3156344 RepID=UPI003391FFA9
MPVNRRQKIRRISAIVAGSIVIVALGIYLPLTLLAPLNPAQAEVSGYSSPTRVAASLSWPGYGASAISAVGFPETLASNGTAGPLPIASISKIVTVLVALEAKPLAVGEPGPTVTFSAADSTLFAKYTAMNGTAKPMKTGSTLSELDLLRVVLVASANNYADALATWAYGNQPAFLDATRTWLSAHGMNHTTIVEPTGINPQNTSTATDLLILGKLALDNPVLSTIVSTKTVSVPGVGDFHNTNGLLGRDGVDGIKSGTLEDFGTSLLFAADYRVGGTEVRLIGAVIGASDHDALYGAVKSLLSTVKSGFSEITLAKKGQVFASYSTPWEHVVKAVAQKDVSTVVWSDTPVTVKIEPTTEVGLVRKGGSAGSVTFTAGEATVTVPLVLNHSITDPGPWWRLFNPAPLLTRP